MWLTVYTTVIPFCCRQLNSCRDRTLISPGFCLVCTKLDSMVVENVSAKIWRRKGTILTSRWHQHMKTYWTATKGENPYSWKQWRRLDKHSHQEQTLAPSEQKSVAAPAFKTEVLERGGNRKWSMGATRKSMYALKAVLRMFS